MRKAEDPGTGESMLWLGTQTTEIEALFALVLTAPTLLAERRSLSDLADAAERLAFYARHAATGSPLRHRPALRATPSSPRARRRAALAQRGADLIITWTTRNG